MKFEIWNGTQSEWDKLIFISGNINIYQSYSWGEFSKSSRWKTYRLIEKDKNKKGLNLTILLREYPLGVGVVWCQGIKYLDFSEKKNSIQKAIKDVLKIRIIYLRLRFLDEYTNSSKSKLLDQGWKKCYSNLSNNETLIYNFEKNLFLSKNWKKNLKRSESSNISISQWQNPNAEIIFDLYKKLEEFKNLKRQFSLFDINQLIEKFGKDLIVVIGKNSDGKIISLRGALIIKNYALDIFSISTYEGRKKYAGYGTFWKLLEICRNRKIKSYDLGGIDKRNNKSVYNFKKGTGAEDYKYLGEYDWSNFKLFRHIFGLIIYFYV